MIVFEASLILKDLWACRPIFLSTSNIYQRMFKNTLWKGTPPFFEQWQASKLTCSTAA